MRAAPEGLPQIVSQRADVRPPAHGHVELELRRRAAQHVELVDPDRSFSAIRGLAPPRGLVEPLAPHPHRGKKRRALAGLPAEALHGSQDPVLSGDPLRDSDGYSRSVLRVGGDAQMRLREIPLREEAQAA